MASRSAPVLSGPNSPTTNVHAVKKQLTLHDHYVYESDLLIHPDLYTNIFQPGDLVRLSQADEGAEIVLKLPDYDIIKNKVQGGSAPNFQVNFHFLIFSCTHRLV